ncbi:N-acetylmuramoyl-L-alanine amidase [Akkermansiaceae bacterium]|nr:N-acetylmuramoyl-L-alanine amidase [Akkermansiaceae bacterium]
MRNPAPIIATATLGVFAIFLLLRPEKTDPQPPPAPAPQPDLSILAEPPDWPALAAYQHTITRSDFEKLLTEIFTTDDTWRTYISLSDHSAEILTSTDPSEPPFILEFATPAKTLQPPRTWQSTGSLPSPPPDQALANLHIAIDPGHIGGEWAKIEGRWFQIGSAKPVIEGDMTLRVAEILKPLLEAMGAKVSLVRSTNQPVTPLRPENFTRLAEADSLSDPASLRLFAEKLFYRTAEIRARAKLVNETIQPDLVLCLHFNAEAWGDPAQPELVPRTHFHILLNGAYTSDEIHLADQRFAMLEKLLQRTHEEEALVSETVARTFAEISGLPPYIYQGEGANFRPVNANPFLWARNLLANRLYDCPVIYMEPYVMNSNIDYPRFQAGDYEGLREINGQHRPSIYREYATALATGLANHYSRMER